jgi:hypothetical protein
LISFIRLRVAASRLDTLFPVPIANHFAIHFKVIVVSRRSRDAICTLFLSPLRRVFNSASAHPRRFSSCDNHQRADFVRNV